MSYINIQYNNLYDLIYKFQTKDFTNEAPSPQSNFVIVNRLSYDGSYGGIYHKEEIKTFTCPFIFGTINSGYVIVWWQLPCANYGDLSLTKKSFALVTPDMYLHMKKSIVYQTIKSSYY